MNDLNSPFEAPTKPSSVLNTLTILTIIWSVISIVQNIYTYLNIEKSYAEMQKLFDSGKLNDAPGFVKKPRK